MKKTLTIAISMMSLTVALAIGSFAWYKLPNDGILSTDIKTQETKLDIYFSETQSAQSSIIPAKLKKGVLNDVSGTITGNNVKVPIGRDCLPKIDASWNYEYNVAKDEYLTNSIYLEYPASVIYNQFQLFNKGPQNGKYNITFSYDISYYNVDENGGQTDNIQKFKQKDALSFNFFFSEGAGLTDEQLKIMTTADTVISNKKTIETVAYENRNTLKLVNTINNTNLSGSNLEKNQVDDYRFKPVAEQVSQEGTNYYKYTFNVNQLTYNTTYYIILESYYAIPGALVEGNLPLTGRFIVNLEYETMAAK